MGATLDGNAVNRRLIKIHDLRSDLLTKCLIHLLPMEDSFTSFQAHHT